MKKTVFILLLAILSVQAYSQKGDLTVGLKGGYVYSPHYYNGSMYGFDVAYNISDPLEVIFTGMTNPNVPYNVLNMSYKPNSPISESNKKYFTENLAVYSANLDFRLYLIHMQTWATGPALGGQYYIVGKNQYGPNSTNSANNTYTNKALGFNLGWHVRVNLTDNLILNGGWRYTNAKAKDKNSVYNLSFDMSYNLFYLGIAYMFEFK